MKYELSIVDRIVLGQLLGNLAGPGNYLYFKELRKLQEKVAFTEAEAKELDLNVSENKVTWSVEKASTKLEVDIGDKILGQIVDTLKGLDKAEKLMPEHLSVYEKFVGEESEA